MSRYCMNCGERVGGPVLENWKSGASVFFECGDYTGGSYEHEGTLEVEVCPFCNHQQIDVSGQYGNLPLTEDDDDEQAS